MGSQQKWRVHWWWLIVLMVIVGQIASANTNTKNKIITAYTYLLSRHIKWDTQKLHRQHRFIITVLDKNIYVAQAMKHYLRGMKIADVPVEIKPLKNPAKISSLRTDVLLVMHTMSSHLKDILHRLPPQTVLISEDAPSTKYTMINLYEDSSKRIKIKLNRENLDHHAIEVDSTILLVGGSSVGVSKLYQSSLKMIKQEAKKYQHYRDLNRELQKRLKKHKAIIATLQKEIDAKRAESLKHTQEIARQKEEIAQQTQEIVQREEAIAAIKKQLEVVEANMKVREAEEQKLIAQLQESKRQLQQRNSELEALGQQIEQNRKIVEEKLHRANRLDAKIKEQEIKLNEQHSLIQRQSFSLLLVAAIALLLFVFAIYLYINDKRIKKLNRELALAKEEAEYANRSKSLFLTNMSHELRTPLNAILGFSELLLQNESVAQAHRKTLEIIYNSGSFLLSLINDILDIAKMESGKITIEKHPSNLTYLLNDTVALMNNRAEEKGLSIVTIHEGSIPECVIVDEKKLRQVLLNYLSNAIKYSKRGKIEVTLAFRDKHLKISVKDQGEGISKEDSKIIFEPFIQVGEASASTGTGLGLAITKQFVEAMGGQVGVESQEGEGSLFWAEIPYMICTSMEKTDYRYIPAMTTKKVTGLAPTSKPIRVLIVEDSLSNALLLKDLLSLISSKTEIVTDGAEAIRYLKEHSFDVIFMDMRLPTISGEEAIKEIRSFNQEVVIIAMSASTMEEKQVSLKAIGVNDILHKPYKVYELYDILHYHKGLEYTYEEQEEGEGKKREMNHEYFVEKLKEVDRTTLQEIKEQAVLLSQEDMKEIIAKVTHKDKTLGSMLKKRVEQMNFIDILNALDEVLER